MSVRQRISLLGILLGAVVGIVSSSLVVGREARVVDVITIAASGVALGASIASFVKGRAKGR